MKDGMPSAELMDEELHEELLTPECCGNCRFSKEYTNVAVEGGYSTYETLHCRRYPPVQQKDIDDPIYPKVGKEAWCGEYKAGHVIEG